MSTVQDTPRPGVDGWFERTSVVGRLETRWLERTLDVRTGRVEYYCGDYTRGDRDSKCAAIAENCSGSGAVACTDSQARETVTLQRGARSSTCSQPAGRAGAVRRDPGAEHAIETRGLETGGGLIGPPIRDWHQRAHVAIANVAVASRGRNKVQLAYGQIEATEADLIRFQDSPMRRVGDWHVHPSCPPGRVGQPSPIDTQTWLAELDRIDRSRPATRYLGIIATAGERGRASTPELHGWVVRRDKRNRPICEPATLSVGR